MNLERFRQTKRQRRQRRVRARVIGSPARPRLAVFRSVRFISGQVIDDATGRTMVAVHERELTDQSGTKSERAQRVGQLLAERARAARVERVVFDRRHYRYHGRIAAFANGARAGGLLF